MDEHRQEPHAAIHINIDIRLAPVNIDECLDRDLWSFYEAAFILSGYDPPVNLPRVPALISAVLGQAPETLSAWSYWYNALKNAARLWTKDHKHPKGLRPIADAGMKFIELRVEPNDVIEWVNRTGRSAKVHGPLLSRGKQSTAGASADAWKIKARMLAQQFGEARYERGERLISARNICEKVAEELGKNPAMHGERGARTAEVVRREALRGWRFKAPKG